MDIGLKFLSWARLFGLLSMNSVLFQIILIGRIKWLKGRYEFESLSRYHKENGRVAVVAIILHPIFINLGYSLIRRLNFTYPEYISRPLVFLAPIALFLLVGVVILSNPLVFNKINYKWWYNIHLFTYAAIALVMGHQFLAGGDFQRVPAFLYYWIGLYLFVFINFLVYRLILPMYQNNKHKFRVEKIEKETHDTHSIYISGQNMKNFTYEAGQFLVIRISGLGREMHPFTISKLYDGKTVRVTVKSSGDYTKKLETVKPGVKMYIEGPLGKFTPKTCKKDKVLFIAGGVGITPIRALLEKMGKEGKEMILLYANKTKNDIIFKGELSQLSSKYSIPMHYFFSREKEVDANEHLGRIKIIDVQNLCPDLKDRDIFICAPLSMIKQFVRNLIDKGIKKDNIHFEKFNW